MSNHELSSRQEAFAVALAAGASQSEAYRQAGYSIHRQKTAHEAGSRLARNIKVQARLKELRHVAIEQSFLSYSEKRNLLAEIARDPLSRSGERIKAIEVDSKLGADAVPGKRDGSESLPLLNWIRERMSMHAPYPCESKVDYLETDLLLRRAESLKVDTIPESEK